jgi:uncharacterized protein (UPF0335 family)
MKKDVSAKKAGPIDAGKLVAFADRLRNLREAFKQDASDLIEDATAADIEAPALRRLVSWLSQDHAKRAEREAIDDQYRFLAGERATPATPPAESLLALAIDLYRSQATVRTVAETLGVSVGKAHALRAQAAAFLVHVNMNMNAPKVREMVADDIGQWLPQHDHNTGEIIEDDAKPAPASILPSPFAWAAITAVREEHHAAIEAAREAKRDARRREMEQLNKMAAITDDDMPDQPAFLRRGAA